jgi:hypothetical protein
MSVANSIYKLIYAIIKKNYFVVDIFYCMIYMMISFELLKLRIVLFLWIINTVKIILVIELSIW